MKTASSRSQRGARRAALGLAVLLCAGAPLGGMQAETPPPRSAQSGTQTSVKEMGPSNSPDGIAVGDPERPLESDHDRAWDLLTDAVHDTRHGDVRVQALAALGLMGNSRRSIQLILEALGDPDVDIRTAAVLAAGQTKSPLVNDALHRMLDDKEPQVAYAAATVLWKSRDRSGEDILMAVVNGERRANATLMNGTLHTMNKDLHHPGTLAKLGALQGASMLLGPFGYGLTAIEYMRKNGGDSARVSAVEEIAQDHTAPVRKTLIAALKDKDVAVRVAAAKALEGYREPEVATALAEGFDDPKMPVRLTAAAAYLSSTGAAQRKRPAAEKMHGNR